MLNFLIDTDAPKTALQHYWEKCVGSCHAYTALREDYREQLLKAHKDAGFQFVRFHGLLDDDMSVVFMNRKGELVYNFFNIDSVFDFLLSIDMKPFIELGFMPEVLASTSTTCFHYKGNVSKPKDYFKWDELIRRLTAHLVERYGIAEVRSWFFEVWNEPNLKYFFEGTQDDYFELYDHTARAVKSVDPGLSVGGPATACNAWIADFIRFCEANCTPLDFISTHHYPTDDFFWSKGISVEDFMKEISEKKDVEVSSNIHYYSRGVLTRMIKTAKQEANKYPLYYTEWNCSAQVPDRLHDVPYCAALVTKTIIDNLDVAEAYSFWTFTDIFEEGGQLPGEFHGGFGLQTVHGIPKPTYRAFELLHQLGNERLTVTGEQETVGMIASCKENEISVVAYNHNIPGAEILPQHVSITLKHKTISGAEITLIDENSCNPYHLWEEMDSPDYLKPEQLEALYSASKVSNESLHICNCTVSSTIDFVLPPHSVAMIRLC